ncbi:cupin domain-containing protein [Paenibacillus polymyxa]|uniref:cupin domain-containing protein n=1 Tax=Paenibacillus polymyxa TaxID=1406 RepID=UPI0020249C3F|nr:cupin domain-containing protein [Paenibacillus polymyxa]URJ34343.1 cupin domain-containing protein [Paenibacillus polymyxa]
MYHKSCHHFPWHIPKYNSCNYNYRSYDPQYYNWYNYDSNLYEKTILRDYGQSPFVVNMDQAAKQNKNYRTAIWTGKHLQVTLMSINVGDDIGLEAHPTTDQFIRIEEGQGLVQMGDRKDQLDFQVMAYDGYAIMIPAGKWHNVINTGNMPLKIYVIYAPPEHPFGTVHESKEIAMSAER